MSQTVLWRRLPGISNLRATKFFESQYVGIGVTAQPLAPTDLHRWRQKKRLLNTIFPPRWLHGICPMIRSKTSKTLIGFVFFMWMLVPAWLPADEWITGTAFQRELGSRSSITWKENPLGDGLQAISKTHGLAIFVDRRVDFTRLITLTARDQPVLSVVQKVANQGGNDAITVGDVIYVGPPPAVARINSLVDDRKADMRKLPTARQRELLTPSPVAWPRLSTPKDVLRTIALNHKLRVVGDEIPHDLWAAGDLPPLSAAESLSLLFIGFGRSFELSPDGSALRLATIAGDEPFVRNYLVVGAKKKSIEDFVAGVTGASVSNIKGGVAVKGDWRVHQAIGRSLSPEVDDKTGGGTTTTDSKVYSLNVEQQPALAVLNAVTKQMGVLVEATDEAKEKGAARISFNVVDVNRDELIHAILDPVELTFQWKEKTLIVK